jgi:anti-sigma B factor antagonist
MALQFYEWEVQGVTVVHLTGQLTLGDGTAVFRKLVHDTVDSGKKKIVLDMSEVYYVDSSGLGELVAAHMTVSRQGGLLALSRLTKRVQDVVQLTKVYRVVEVFDTEQAAVQSLAAKSH